MPGDADDCDVFDGSVFSGAVGSEKSDQEYEAPVPAIFDNRLADAVGYIR